jgi:CBS domain containing-hemolysin-like protein
MDIQNISTISQLIQLSVAPVFLLAGVAGLLNVFTGRLTRIIDRVDKLERQKLNKDISKKYLEKRHRFLSMRMENINLAIFFGTFTGLLVALVILTMFFNFIYHLDGSTIISIEFILAMISLILSLVVFLKEIYYTTAFIKEQK